MANTKQYEEAPVSQDTDCDVVKMRSSKKAAVLALVDVMNNHDTSKMSQNEFVGKMMLYSGGACNPSHCMSIYDAFGLEDSK